MRFLVAVKGREGWSHAGVVAGRGKRAKVLALMGAARGEWRGRRFLVWEGRNAFQVKLRAIKGGGR